MSEKLCRGCNPIILSWCASNGCAQSNSDLIHSTTLVRKMATLSPLSGNKCGPDERLNSDDLHIPEGKTLDGWKGGSATMAYVVKHRKSKQE